MKKNLITLLVILTSNYAFSQLKPVLLPKSKENISQTDFEKANINKKYDQFAYFYEDINYKGKKYMLTPGVYTLKNLGADANDFFSSAIIPSNLSVAVFDDDELNGNFYILNSDYDAYKSLPKMMNNDFTKVQIYMGKTTLNQDEIGYKNLNDKISSILIFERNNDRVELYDDCDFKGHNVVLKPFELLTYAMNYVNKKWGYADMSMFGSGFSDKLSSLKLFGNVASIQVFTNKNFELKDGASRTFTTDISCLKDIAFTTKNAFFAGNSDWNDRASSIIINLRPGRVTIEN